MQAPCQACSAVQRHAHAEVEGTEYLARCAESFRSVHRCHQERAHRLIAAARQSDKQKVERAVSVEGDFAAETFLGLRR